MHLDILAFAAHPDDVELSCIGTLIKHITKGDKVGVVDLTRGELGTRGTPETRKVEAAEATRLSGLHARENLGFADGFFSIDDKHLLEVVKMIRKYRPRVVLANALSDRHPDHGRAAKLVSEACFLSGLIKVETKLEGDTQSAWRPKQVYHYIQDRYMKPDFAVDISEVMEKKLEIIKTFKTQFYDPNSNEPVTPISTPEFMDFLYGRAAEMGRLIGVRYAEGFVSERVSGVTDLNSLF